jgi:hypothetical protein
LVRSRKLGGYGLDAQWNDDFHHALHTLLTSERSGYYEDFGLCRDLATAFREGFVYSGDYSRYRKRRHGNDSRVSRPIGCWSFLRITTRWAIVALGIDSAHWSSRPEVGSASGDTFCLYPAFSWAKSMAKPPLSLLCQPFGSLPH